MPLVTVALPETKAFEAKVTMPPGLRTSRLPKVAPVAALETDCAPEPLSVKLAFALMVSAVLALVKSWEILIALPATREKRGSAPLSTTTS